VDAAGLGELFEDSCEHGCQTLGSTKGKEFPEQLRQLWLLQDVVSKSNAHKISCGHLSLSAAVIVHNVMQGLVFVHAISLYIKFILLVSTTYCQYAHVT